MSPTRDGKGGGFFCGKRPFGGLYICLFLFFVERKKCFSAGRLTGWSGVAPGNIRGMVCRQVGGVASGRIFGPRLHQLGFPKKDPAGRLEAVVPRNVFRLIFPPISGGLGRTPGSAGGTRVRKVCNGGQGRQLKRDRCLRPLIFRSVYHRLALLAIPVLPQHNRRALDCEPLSGHLIAPGLPAPYRFSSFFLSCSACLILVKGGFPCPKSYLWP
jgi:hypothetical protein